MTALLAHLLGMMKLDADPAKLARQFSAANQRAATTGEMRIDALTALQVAGHLAIRSRIAVIRRAKTAIRLRIALRGRARG